MRGMPECTHCGGEHVIDVCPYLERDALRNQVAELQRKLAQFQLSEFHPDWSLLQASQESLREHREIIRKLRGSQKPVAIVAINSTGLYWLRNAEPDLADGEPLYRHPPNLPAMIERARQEEREAARKHIFGCGSYDNSSGFKNKCTSCSVSNTCAVMPLELQEFNGKVVKEAMELLLKHGEDHDWRIMAKNMGDNWLDIRARSGK